MSNEMNITMPRIAVVEDEEDLRLSLIGYLASSGYRVWGAESAEAFYKQLLVAPVEVVILDVGLPGESGLQVARHLRELGGIKTIMLSGRGSVDDRVEGLNQGASRYLVKPVDMRELVANIQSAVRAQKQLAAVAGSASAASWTLLRVEWILLAPDGTQIALTTREFAFMDCLLRGSRQAASRVELALALTGGNMEGFDFHRIDMVVARLRQKIAVVTANAPIKTEQGVGFVFTAKCKMQ
ncbi:response regulator receiver protein [Methylobacter tundripaludum SV96]|uniref:Response regulator receiver protein n=2 Tax=Methylobacter tundripaludum TaxID=173365 RepID=G3IUM6_METTV|nr:response regulator receiver protein [Methylobacter tundripaludum SV96]